MPDHTLIGLIFFGFSGLFIGLVFADGLASETLAPVIVNGRSITLTIGSTPASTTDPSAGTEIGIILNENNNPVNSVTFSVESMRGNQILFDHSFKSDNGSLLLLITPQNSESVEIQENYGGLPSVFGGNNGNAKIIGPIFDSGGLYKFKIKILTMDSYDNKLSQPIKFNAAISIPDITSHEITDNEYGKQVVKVIGYYDQTGDFKYNTSTKFINFSMPFDWSQQNIDQVSVVHQEIRIPRSFGDFLVPNYDTYVNEVQIPEESVTVDDYSSDDRTIHIILNKSELEELEKKQNPDNMMNFAIHPSDNAKFPITAFTRNAQFKINLSWDPAKIVAGSNTKFYFKVLDPYLINRTVSSVSYDFSIIQNQQVLFKKSGVTIDSQTEDNIIEVPIPGDKVGPIIIAFENLNGNNFAGVEFTSSVTKPIPNQIFPITLESFQENSDSTITGKYKVDLTWFPTSIISDQQAEFVFTIKDKSSGNVVPQSSYDFVLLQNDKEILRKSGLAAAGGDFVDYTFSKEQKGPTTLRLENINGSGEMVEIPLSVTPEFPLGLTFVITIVFLVMIVVSGRSIRSRIKL